MDKIQLLQERKTKLIESSKEIREDIFSLIDENSFVELSAFSFSKNEFYNESVAGEGVVTGFATINGYPFYIVAQNFNAFSGGVSEANCNKIVKCLDEAEKNAMPVIYLLNTHGVQIGEGVAVLEGLGKLLLRSTQLKGVVPQYAIVNGDVYGSAAMLAAISDFTFFIEKKSVLAINSPFVLSAKAGKNISKEEVGSAKVLDKSGIPAFEVESLGEVKAKIATLTELLSGAMVDAELNDSIPALNAMVDVPTLMTVFESSIEIGAICEKDVKTVLGRIGGISVAAVIFDGGEDGVLLDAAKLAKIKNFAELASCYQLPFVVFSNVKGICPCMQTNNSRVMKEAAEYLDILDTIDTAKIAVVYGKAIGLGYSLFAAKSVGFDYACAFANAKIALFDNVQGAKIELSDERADKAALADKYADENADPIHAAKGGYIDAIIEPQFVKQHLIASLQMLIR
jgi:acetyl-CoA carboxylase carboxyltransferase component